VRLNNAPAVLCLKVLYSKMPSLDVGLGLFDALESTSSVCVNPESLDRTAEGDYGRKSQTKPVSAIVSNSQQVAPGRN
jgi:hypothetical protein